MIKNIILNELKIKINLKKSNNQDGKTQLQFVLSIFFRTLKKGQGWLTFLFIIIYQELEKRLNSITITNHADVWVFCF